MRCGILLGSAETAPYYLEFLMRGFLEQIKAGQS